MEYKNFLTNKDLEENIEVHHDLHNLRIKKLFGYIYRGDLHNNFVLSIDPKFYGSLESASEYLLTEGNIMKRYTTIRQLNILDLSDVDNNFSNIMKFFENEFIYVSSEENKIEKNLLEKKIMVILLQICFGIMIDNKLRMYNTNHEEITKYLNDKKISDSDIKLLFFVEKIFSKQSDVQTDTIGSRFGMRIFDKLLMKLLKCHLTKYKIDGVLYIEKQNIDKSKTLCNRFNKLLKLSASMCPPSEICIFNPSIVLGGIQMWIIKNNKMVRIKHKFKKSIRRKYKRMSTYDLYLESLK